jgi:hypothetical protein
MDYIASWQQQVEEALQTEKPAAVIPTGRPAYQAQAGALGRPGLAGLCMACLYLGAPYTY